MKVFSIWRCAGSAGVRLAVTQAVSALTALPSDKITVLQGKP